MGATGTVPGFQETPPTVEMVTLPIHLLKACVSRELGGSDFFITWKLCVSIFCCWQNKVAYNDLNVFPLRVCRSEA